jgi:predicted RNase H-like HicB family nuclease
MKEAYPTIFTPLDEGGFMAYVPDMEINTQGETLIEAIEMARDAIGIMGITMQDMKQSLPTPSQANEIQHNSSEIVSMVDIDFNAYRTMIEKKSVRRNVSLPSWLNDEAVKAGINVSSILQEAIKSELHLVDPYN